MAMGIEPGLEGVLAIISGLILGFSIIGISVKRKIMKFILVQYII